MMNGTDERLAEARNKLLGNRKPSIPRQDAPRPTALSRTVRAAGSPIVLGYKCCGGTRISGETLHAAVVFVFYRMEASTNPIPVERLNDHFAWNDELYRQSGAHVYVVTDRAYDVPSYARCVVYPEPMEVFWKTKLLNIGVGLAIKDGCNPIIVTDADIAFTPEAWSRMLGVTDKEALVATCWLASSFESRHEKCLDRAIPTHAATCTKSHREYGGCGTVAMQAANWEKIKYEEACVGYGCDDTIAKKDIEAAGLCIIGHSRSQDQADIFHIAHSAAPQANFSDIDRARTDRWSPDFNRSNFHENRKLYFGRQPR
jgi:hypothetical protein